MRAGESQLSSFDLCYDDPGRARLIVGTLWPSKLCRRNRYLSWNMSDTNRSANEQARRPVVWVGVITLEQTRRHAIASIKEGS
jgi:hypothetical protein